jgi:hypothetical protein
MRRELQRWTDERGKPFYETFYERPRRFDPEDLVDELGSAYFVRTSENESSTHSGE